MRYVYFFAALAALLSLALAVRWCRAWRSAAAREARERRRAVAEFIREDAERARHAEAAHTMRLREGVARERGR